MVFLEWWHDVQTEGDKTRAKDNSRASDFYESTPMFDAIQLGDWKQVEALLKRPAEEDEPGCGGGNDDPLSIMTCGCLDDDETHNISSVEFEPTEYGREQAATWVTGTNERNRQGKAIMWKQLPIHAAICSGAPTFILRGLVKAYPEGLHAKTTPNGNLPLHLAIQLNCHSESDILFLLTAFPGALKIKNKKGLVPSECGAGGENLFKDSAWSKYQLLSNKQYVDETGEVTSKGKKLTVLERTSEAPPKDLKPKKNSKHNRNQDSISPELMNVLGVEDREAAATEEKRRLIVFPGLTAEGRKERKNAGSSGSSSSSTSSPSPAILTASQKEERKIAAIAASAKEPKVVKVNPPKKRFGFWTKRSKNKKVVPA